MYDKIGKSAEYIHSIVKDIPEVGVVLGSGLGSFIDTIEDKIEIPYIDIPYFHNPSVEGHGGRLIFGTVSGKKVACLQGRIHVYEGHPMEDIVFPTRVLATWGIKSIILTNAAGGVNFDYKPGDLVLINDHINLMGRNPLIGPNINELGPRFPDMSYAYTPRLREILKEGAKEIGYQLKEGVYAAMLGPTYETPAEVKMARILGADMVGMSTVPEAIAANHLNIEVAGISCISNLAAGMSKEKLNHEEVKEEALKVMETFTNLLVASIKKF